MRHDRGRHRRHGLPRLQLQGAPFPEHRLPSDSAPRSAGCTRAHPPNHPPTRLPAACWQVKDDPTAHQMDLVFDGLLDRAAEAEGCAGASPRVENCGRPARPKRRIGRGWPRLGAAPGVVWRRETPPERQLVRGRASFRWTCRRVSPRVQERVRLPGKPVSRHAVPACGVQPRGFL